MMFVLGIVLFSSTVLFPQFLQTLMGYTAESAGMVLSVAAILLAFLLPAVGRLAARFQARHLLAFGWITLAMAMYLTCKRMDLLISFRAATWLRVWQYLPVGFLFVPLTMAAYVGLGMHSAYEQALARMYSMVMQQAQALSYIDVYWLLGLTSALMFLLCFLLQKNEPGAASGEVAIG